MAPNSLLIIEDSAIQAKIIAQRFETLTDFRLLSAQTLAEAENLAGEHGGDIFGAIADLNLPDGPNGEAVDMCLKYNIPCMVLAATIDDAMRKTFAEKQVTDYFVKGGIDDLEPLVAAMQRLRANYDVKALIVDDSATQRSVVRKMLAIQRIASLEASDGVEALEVLAANADVRLVITDFEMPRMDGITLVQEIRNKFRLSQMAIIGLSSAGSSLLTAKFLKYGANDFLTKPFEAEEFSWRVNQTLNILDVMQQLRELKKN